MTPHTKNSSYTAVCHECGRAVTAVNHSLARQLRRKGWHYDHASRTLRCGKCSSFAGHTPQSPAK